MSRSELQERAMILDSLAVQCRTCHTKKKRRPVPINFTHHSSIIIPYCALSTLPLLRPQHQQFLSLLLDSVILRLSLYTSTCTNIRSIIYARLLRPSFQASLAHTHFGDPDPFTRIPSPLTRALTSVHSPKLPARLNSYSSLSTPYIITDALSDLVLQLTACRVFWRLPSALLNRFQPCSTACCGRPALVLDTREKSYSSHVDNRYLLENPISYGA